MPHKITLTGIPTSDLREKGNIYSFDMEEKGSPNAPKGLPASSTISYTVFVSKKSFNKAEIDINDFRNTKLLIQGEPTLDLPMDECPGEIGVICFQLSKIEPKQNDTENEDNAKKDVPEEKIEIRQAPDLSMYDFICLKDILIPENLSSPNPKRLEKVIDFIKETGSLECAIEINYNKGKLYVSNKGYIYYLAAKETGLEKVPVDLIISKKYIPTDANMYMLLEKIKIPEEFEASIPSSNKIAKVDSYFKKFGMIDKSLTVEKDSFLLTDGYSRYVYLKQNNVLYAPIKLV